MFFIDCKMILGKVITMFIYLDYIEPINNVDKVSNLG